MRGSNFNNKEDNIMTKKDLVSYSSSPLRRMFEASRFGDMFDGAARELDRIWNDWDLDVRTFADMQPRAKFPKINVAETDDSYEIEVALAGFDKEDISMEIKDNCLLVKADKQEEISDEFENKKYLMREISSRSFRRVINLQKKINTDSIECTHKDGIIKCVLKKDIVKVEGDTIKIEINS
jgi:HSP20 family protein